ncbi:4-hydroxy-tetrahydrodipicolinate synthase [Gammaproteobacteria bacterium]|nr:4-hydroxy-tetrahydrodipicolinate synthase [Gammaproteobacteria bacterium]
MRKGSIPALVTPMHQDGSVDYSALEALVEWHVASGSAAIVSVGTTGESPTFDIPEHLAVISETVRVAAGRLPIIAGTGSNATSEALVLTTNAEKAGADAILSVVPYYNKPPQRGLYAHFRAIADSTELPIILYNVPGRCACDIDDQTVYDLADVPNIIGIKDATGDIGRVESLRRLVGEDFLIYGGEDSTACELMLRGGDGVISVVANVAPQLFADMCQAALAGNVELARALDQQLLPLHQALFIEPNPIPTKWALEQMGRIKGGIRLPLVPLDAAYHDPVVAAMRHADIDI